MKMLEKTIEMKLVREAGRMGGIAMKFTSPGMAGVPDRLVLMPDGRAAFVELKAPGKKMRPLQKAWKAKLESLGFRVFCVDNEEQIKGVLDEIKG